MKNLKTVLVITTMALLVAVIVRKTTGTIFLLLPCTCPTATIEPDEVPFSFDPNGLPAPLIGWMELQVGQYAQKELRICEPDGEDVTVEPNSMPVGMVYDANEGRWHWTPEMADIGVHILAFDVTDIPVDNYPPESSSAAWVINVFRASNSRPCFLNFFP